MAKNTVLDEAIKVCDENQFSSIERAFDKFCSHALEKTNGDPKVVAAQIDFATKMYTKCLDDLEKSYLSVKKDYDITIIPSIKKRVFMDSDYSVLLKE